MIYIVAGFFMGTFFTYRGSAMIKTYAFLISCLCLFSLNAMEKQSRASESPAYDHKKDKTSEPLATVEFINNSAIPGYHANVTHSGQTIFLRVSDNTFQFYRPRKGEDEIVDNADLAAEASLQKLTKAFQQAKEVAEKKQWYEGTISFWELHSDGSIKCTCRVTSTAKPLLAEHKAQ